jgi:hypothetical protein
MEETAPREGSCNGGEHFGCGLVGCVLFGLAGGHRRFGEETPQSTSQIILFAKYNTDDDNGTCMQEQRNTTFYWN